VLEEKLDATEGNGGSVAGVMLDIPEREEILLKLFLGDQIRGFVKALRQLTHCADIGFLGPF
jgi:hypothetical protein